MIPRLHDLALSLDPAWKRLIRAGVLENICKFILTQCDDPSYPFSCRPEERRGARAKVEPFSLCLYLTFKLPYMMVFQLRSVCLSLLLSGCTKRRNDPSDESLADTMYSCWTELVQSVRKRILTNFIYLLINFTAI